MATQKSYQRIWMRFEEFCSQFSPCLQSLPASVAVVSAFFAYLFQLGLAGSTLTSYSSALSFKHKAAGLEDPAESFIIKKMLRGARNLTSSARTRLPITLPLLARLCQSIQFSIPNAYNRVLLKAMYLFAFYAFCRVGEITGDASPGTHTMLLSDIAHLSSTSLTVVFRHFKFSNPLKTFSLSISSTGTDMCPVAAILQYLSRRGVGTQGPLFIFQDGVPVTRHFFTSTLVQVLEFSGLLPSQYKSHSFRIGAATWAAIKGFTSLQIQTMGRWKSSAHLKYVRIVSM